MTENYPCPYKDYYIEQAGSGVSRVFVGGTHSQKGNGIGSVLSGLARWAMPFLFKGARYLGNQAVSTGEKIYEDVLSGQNVKTAAKRRFYETVDGIKGQLGNGIKRRRTTRKKVISTKKPKKVGSRKNTRKKERDIFTAQ